MGSNYWILDTDYNHFSIVYACHTITRTKSAQAAWILSKDLELVDEVKQKVNDYIDEYFERSELRWSIQDQDM
jgi:apolipoprotein D and lipocalin family protein